jgi:hypothetical protein
MNSGDQSKVPQRKHEKRRVSLDGQDPIEVLKRLLGTKPGSQPSEEKEPPRPAG